MLERFYSGISDIDRKIHILRGTKTVKGFDHIAQFYHLPSAKIIPQHEENCNSPSSPKSSKTNRDK